MHKVLGPVWHTKHTTVVSGHGMTTAEMALIFNHDIDDANAIKTPPTWKCFLLSIILTPWLQCRGKIHHTNARVLCAYAFPFLNFRGSPHKIIWEVRELQMMFKSCEQPSAPNQRKRKQQTAGHFASQKEKGSMASSSLAPSEQQCQSPNQHSLPLRLQKSPDRPRWRIRAWAREVRPKSQAPMDWESPHACYLGKKLRTR